MTSERVIEERVIEGFAMTPDGRIVHNSWQLDDPMLRRKYEDGSIELRSERTGELIMPRYYPENTDMIPPCQHCGKRPW